MQTKASQNALEIKCTEKPNVSVFTMATPTMVIKKVPGTRLIVPRAFIHSKKTSVSWKSEKMAPPEISLTDIYRSIIPFVGVMVVALCTIMLAPEIALWLPNYVYGK